MILPETLRKAATFFPEKEAIVCGGKRWKYREFADRVACLAHHLKSSGVERKDHVAVLHPNCHYFLESYYGITRAGAASVPINYRLSPLEIAFILRDSESKVLIADPAFEKQVDAIREEIDGVYQILWTGNGMKARDPRDVDYERAIEASSPGRLSEPPAGDEDIAQIYYTSGTTGRPKGVMLSHRNVCTHALGTIGELHLTDRTSGFTRRRSFILRTPGQPGRSRGSGEPMSS